MHSFKYFSPQSAVYFALPRLITLGAEWLYFFFTDGPAIMDLQKPRG